MILHYVTQFVHKYISLQYIFNINLFILTTHGCIPVSPLNAYKLTSFKRAFEERIPTFGRSFIVLHFELKVKGVLFSTRVVNWVCFNIFFIY